MIPLFDLKLSKKIESQILKEIKLTIESNTFILGNQVESFEKSFSKYLGVKFSAGVANGTDAITLALKALGIKKGDKVLTVALTSPFTALAIINSCAIPVFCDVDENTWTMDIDDAREKIDKNTRVIIPVHLFGNPCNMKAILEPAKNYKLKVIEDACQTHGAKIGRKMAGSFGDAAAFSFYPTKNLGAMGDAGIAVTNNIEVSHLLKILRHGGQTKRFWHAYLGLNSRLDEIQAAILRTKLKYLARQTQRRVMLADRYIKSLSDIPIGFQQSFNGSQSSYHLFVIRTEKRDRLKNYLRENSVETGIYYPHPVHKQPAFRRYGQNKLKVTESLTKELLAIPLYPTLLQKQQNVVINKIRSFFAN